MIGIFMSVLLILGYLIINGREKILTISKTNLLKSRRRSPILRVGYHILKIPKKNVKNYG
jgi:hypothetical protein